MKRNKYVKRVLLSLLIFVLAFSVLSMICTAVFYGAAFPRCDTQGGFAVSYADFPAESYPCTKVRFLSGSNLLTGYCYTCPEPRALVVCAAGFSESGASCLPLMTELTAEGYNVFCYDATGVGESEGAGTVGLSQPARDLKAALKYIAEDRELSRLPVLLYGYSAGGYAVACCLDEEQVRAAVILSGFESPTRLMRETARGYVGLLADVEYPFLLFGNALVFSSYGDKSASCCIMEAGVPVEVYEGVNDDKIPYDVRLSGFLNTDAANVSLILCEEASRSGHDDLWLSDNALTARESGKTDPILTNAPDAEFTAHILDFFDDALKKAA